MMSCDVAADVVCCVSMPAAFVRCLMFVIDRCSSLCVVCCRCVLLLFTIGCDAVCCCSCCLLIVSVVVHC